MVDCPTRIISGSLMRIYIMANLKNSDWLPGVQTRPDTVDRDPVLHMSVAPPILSSWEILTQRVSNEEWNKRWGHKLEEETKPEVKMSKIEIHIECCLCNRPLVITPKDLGLSMLNNIHKSGIVNVFNSSTIPERCAFLCMPCLARRNEFVKKQKEELDLFMGASVEGQYNG